MKELSLTTTLAKEGKLTTSLSPGGGRNPVSPLGFFWHLMKGSLLFLEGNGGSSPLPNTMIGVALFLLAVVKVLFWWRPSREKGKILITAGWGVDVLVPPVVFTDTCVERGLLPAKGVEKSCSPFSNYPHGVFGHIPNWKLDWEYSSSLVFG